MKRFRVNEEIDAQKILLIDEDNKPQTCNLIDAIEMATSQDLQVVEISDSQDKPVCKIMDYKKYMFNLKKKDKEIKKKNKAIEIKEIQIKTKSDINDTQRKIEKMITFLKKDTPNKIKIKIGLKNGLDENEVKKGKDLLAFIFEEIKKTIPFSIESEDKLGGNSINVIIFNKVTK